jgi:hypothetical protein
MSLSVCCLTRDPGPQVAAALEPLRAVADEIVIAADADADDERLGHYAAVADRLLRAEVDYIERSLGWLHAQCSGDWILRLDGDELASAELIRQLPELIEARDVEQYWLPRRWLFPDESHWLDGHPWWPDYQNRLVRNGPQLRFSGRLHTSAERVLPARYATTPIYHLDCLVNDSEKRLSKAFHYEALGTAGHLPFYLPERYSSRPPAPVPDEDRDTIGRALRGDAPPAGKPGRTPHTPLPESDAHWGRRTVAPSAYAAEIQPMEREHWLLAGEHRAVHVVVTNRGTETWGWDMETSPPIRASYRWLHPTGARLTHDGVRTAFPAAVAPGQSAVVPLEVIGPETPGEYVLEVDLVHEGVRWFGCEARVPVRVEPREGLPSRRSGAVPATSAGAVPIPKLIHRIWLGGADPPPQVVQFGESWREHHPGWRMRLWTDRRLPMGFDRAALARCGNTAERSDVLRYALLSRYGGIYADTDVECLRPLDPLIENVQAFAGFEDAGRVGTAILGSTPGHPAFDTLAHEVALNAGRGTQPEATGPPFLTRVLREHPEVMVFPREVFYPYRWDERHLAGGPFPAAYAVHHWSATWVKRRG